MFPKLVRNVALFKIGTMATSATDGLGQGGDDVADAEKVLDVRLPTVAPALAVYGHGVLPLVGLEDAWKWWMQSVARKTWLTWVVAIPTRPESTVLAGPTSPPIVDGDSVPNRTVVVQPGEEVLGAPVGVVSAAYISFLKKCTEFGTYRYRQPRVRKG